jgi:hypothetical protein
MSFSEKLSTFLLVMDDTRNSHKILYGRPNQDGPQNLYFRMDNAVSYCEINESLRYNSHSSHSTTVISMNFLTLSVPN